MFKTIAIAILVASLGGIIGGGIVVFGTPFVSHLIPGAVGAPEAHSEHVKVEAPVIPDSIFVDIKNIYYSSDNGKRTKLIVMDVSIEVKSEVAEEKVRRNTPIIKNTLLNILASEKYKEVKDQNLLAFINANLNDDMAALFKGVAPEETLPVAYVTRLIVQ